MTISMLGTSNIINAQAQVPPVKFKQTIEIINELDTNLHYTGIPRYPQDMKLVTPPPEIVKPGDTGSFTIEYLREIGQPLFIVKYYDEPISCI